MKALVAVSFGTGYPQTRKKTIDAIEADLAREFPDRVFCSAWTSEFLRRKVFEFENLDIESPEGVFKRLQKDGVRDVCIQPTFLADGWEFKELVKLAAQYAGAFEKLSIGKPLMSSEEDVKCLARVLESLFAHIKKEDMLVFMGHGSAEIDTNPYTLLEACFKEDGYEHFSVGTVEFDPGFSPVMDKAKERNPGKIYLTPLMVVAGDHALNDMSGSQEDSWASRLSQAGYATESILKGLGEYKPIREIYVQHAKECDRGTVLLSHF